MLLGRFKVSPVYNVNIETRCLYNSASSTPAFLRGYLLSIMYYVYRVVQQFPYMYHTPCPSLSSPSLAGVSRSVTLVVAYIMTVTGLGWKEALSAVRVVRPSAGPNLGFQRQLQEFEATQADQVSYVIMLNTISE